MEPTLPAYTLPLASIALNKPNEEIAEKEKYEDNGIWFQRMCRWIALNFFNPFSNSFYNGETASYRMSEDMINSWAYYYGNQQNDTFNYTTMINQQNTIQAVFVPDQKIRQLVDHAVGNCIKMIQPMKDSLSARVLSEDKIKEKDQLKKKLKVKKEFDAIVGQAPGVNFAPAGVEEIGEEDDIDDIVNKFKDEEEINFIKLAQSIYYNNQLGKKFEQSALHEFVGNVSTFLVDLKNNKEEISFFPNYNSIVDYRATDDFLTDAMVGGGVQFLTAGEIFAKWGDQLSEEEQDHINAMTQKQYSNWLECYNYWNNGFSNLTHWCRDTGKVACVTTYWIGRKDLRYRKKKYKYGKYKYQFLENNVDYLDSTADGKPVLDDDGNPKKQKGEDIGGDKWGWFVHKCTTIGNYCHVDYGYHPIQIRPKGQKQKPILPTVQFVHRLNLGYARSVVSRLKHYSDEKGRLNLKIQELTGRDMGKVYALYADKIALGEDVTQEIFKDFKTLGFSLFNKSGDATQEDGRLTADVLDFSLAQSIGSYIELSMKQDRDMSDLISMPQASLGTQTSTIGKGVQQKTIDQASYGMLSLYDGLKEHYRRVLQYALNVAKTVKAGKEELIQTDSNEAFLLKISKKDKYEEVGLYVELDDQLEETDKELLRSGLFSYNQNGGTLQAAQALLNTMKLIKFNSVKEGVKSLESFVEKEEKKAIQQGQAQQMQEIQGQATLQAQQQEFIAETEQAKLMHKTFDNKYSTDINNITKLVTSMEQQNTQILALLAKQMQQPPVQTPLEEDIAVNNMVKAEQQQQAAPAI